MPIALKVKPTARTPSGVKRRGEDLYKVLDKARGGLDSLGLRDRHKFDKLERISTAAYRRFSRDGYEGTTLREIAKEAGVALGTLGLYARDKRDLVLLIFNKILPTLLDQGRKEAKGEVSLTNSLIAFFRPFYTAYANNPTLFRIVLSRIYSATASVHGSENHQIRVGLIDDLADLIRRAVSSGECTDNLDLKLQAKSFYFLYFAAVRAWLGDEQPEVKPGITELRALFDIHIAGISVSDKSTQKLHR